MALPSPPQFGTPIPNNPFYFPLTNFVQGATGPLIIGTNLNVDYLLGTLNATGGGGGGSVTSVNAGTGISVTGTATDPVINNTGVLALTAGAGISLSGTQSNITITNTNTNTGTVTSITAGAGLTGGTITSTGTIALDVTGVTPGSYSNASITVDSYGRISLASSNSPVDVVFGTLPVVIGGTSAAPVVSVNAASTAASGVVQLSDSVSSTSSLTAATSAAVKIAYDQVATAVPKSVYANTGDIAVANLANTPVALPIGTEGQFLKVCGTCVGTGGVTWGSLPVASTTVSGIVQLSDSFSTTSSVLAATSTAVKAAYDLANAAIPKVVLTAAGDLIVATGASNGTALPIGAEGQLLTVCGSCVATGGVTWAAQVAATTTNPGVVQLNDTVISTSISQALTANQGKLLQDQINVLALTTNLNLAGTFDATAGVMLTVTSAGTGQGFTVGSNLPAAVAGNLDYFVIVTTEGLYNPPGGGGPYTATQGDWFLSTGTSWQFLNVGPSYPPYATTIDPGVVTLATNALTQAGLNGTTAVTPAAAAFTYIAKTALTAKGALVSASAASTPATLAVGTNGQILYANSASSSGLCWGPGPVSFNVFTQAGDLLVGTGPATYNVLSAGTTGQLLSVNTACADGLEWISPPSSAIPCACITGKGALVSGSAANTPVALPVGADNLVLTACSAALTGLCWAPVISSDIPCACITGKGAILTGSAANTPVALSPGANGFSLVANSACALGLDWVSQLNTSLLTAKGTIISATAANTASSLGVGTDGQVLTACNAAPSGLCWAPATTPAIPCACVTDKGTLITGSAANTPAGLAAGADGLSLVADSTCALGLNWVSQVNTSTYNAKGVLVTATAPSTTTALPPGAEGQLLVACSTCTAGLTWATCSALAIPCALLTAKGSIVAATAANAPAELPVGTNGQILMACSTPAAGLQWQTGAIGPWVNTGGPIQDTGWTSTGNVNVTPLSTPINTYRYRQLGPKEWEVMMMLVSNASFTNRGSGDWIFTLPGALSFDTTLPWQAVFTGSVGAESNRNRNVILPGPNTLNVSYTDSSNQNPFGGGAAVWSSTQFRIFASENSDARLQAMGSTFWGGVGGNAQIQWNLRFQFTSA